VAKKIDPKIAMALMIEAGYKPLEPYKSVDTPWKSECLTCFRIVQPNLGNVKTGKSRCVYCQGRKVDIKEALALLTERKLKPLEPFKGVMFPWKCECLNCGDLVQPALNSLKRGQGGCKRCGRTSAGSKLRRNEQEAINTMLTAGVQPLERYKSRKTPWQSKCLTCEKIVSPALASVLNGQSACTYCAGNKTDPKDAIKLMRESNLEPLDPYDSARAKWRSRCTTCGDIVFPLYNSIQQGQGGCPKCGINRMAEALRYSQEEAIAFVRAAGFEPAEPYIHSENKWKIKCLKCKKFFYPTLHNIKQGSGCPSCAKNGFDPNEKGFFYFLWHPQWEMYQIGITNFPEKRIVQHQKIGWKVKEIRGPMDGHLTQDWETAILRMLKAKGADLSNSKIAGKFDGYSEAWSKSTFQAKSIIDLMQLTDEFEANKKSR
jgi:rRNA maturation endonuclease Nob1